jgi:hypothetical protein
MERRQTRRNLHLHVDHAGLDPLKSYGGNPLDHSLSWPPLLPQPRVAESFGTGKNNTGTFGITGPRGSRTDRPRTLHPQSTITIGSAI